jgi:hypoxanthine phosphoribosyltransferase
MLKVLQDNRYVRANILEMGLKIQKLNQEKMTFIGILKGGLFTTYSLLALFAHKKYDIRVGHLGLSSYGNGSTSTGKLKVTYPLDLAPEDINGRDVWIIDDVIDSGLTLDEAYMIIADNYEPKSIKIAVLVDKKKNRIKQDIMDVPDVVGYTYEEDGFLVGCGMGEGEKYRHLNCLYELTELESPCLGEVDKDPRCPNCEFLQKCRDQFGG